MMKIILASLICLPCLLFSEMMSENYSIPISDNNQGGGWIASDNYKVVNAIGQSIIGLSQSGNTLLSGGLFPVIVPSPGTQTAFVPNNNNVKVYPNPYKKNDSQFGGPGVYFEQISAGCTIRIYNIADELIEELISPATGQVLWDVSKIASGVYIYTVTDGGGGKSVGKIGIVK